MTNTAPGSPVKRGKSKEQLIPQIFLFFQQGTAPRAVGPASGLSGHSASNWMRPRRPSCQELAVRPCAAVSGEIRVSDRESGTRRPFRACVSRPVGAKIFRGFAPESLRIPPSRPARIAREGRCTLHLVFRALRKIVARDEGKTRNEVPAQSRRQHLLASRGAECAADASSPLDSPPFHCVGITADTRTCLTAARQGGCPACQSDLARTRRCAQ